MSNACIPIGNKRSLLSCWGLNYKIVYKSGVDNTAADALSRKPASVLAVTSVTPQWLDDVIATYTLDPVAQDILSKLAVSAVSNPHFSLQDGLIRYNGKI